jgi:hypothetical protein
MECCGGSTYDSKDQVCCDADVYNKMSNHTVCCGSKAIDALTQNCCGHKTMDVRTQGCCAGVTFDKKTHGCCSYNGVYDKRTQICCDGTIKDVDNPKNTKCCWGTPFVTKGPNEQCCGAAGTFDPETHLCCNTKIVKRESLNQECCNETPYDITKEICCGLKPTPLTDGMNSAGCCGSKAIDNTKEICCHNPHDWNNSTAIARTKSFSECCGGAEYNYMTHLCCDNHILKKTSALQSCCGKETFNYHKEICCNEFKFLPNGTQNIINKLYKKTGESMGCCGLKPYDYETEECTGESVNGQWKQKVTPRSQLSYGSRRFHYKPYCGFKTYDEDKEICCDGQIFTKRGSGPHSCCTSFRILDGINKYIPSSPVPLHNHRHPIKIDPVSYVIN